MTGIGPRLKRERVRLKLSQSALGAIGGVESNAQGNYENGLRFPRADYLSRISEVGVDVTYVLTGQTPTAPANDPQARDPAESLERVIAGLHESLHNVNQHLYQMTRLLEARQERSNAQDKAQIDNVRSNAEAISLATIRLIYETARLG